MNPRKDSRNQMFRVQLANLRITASWLVVFMALSSIAGDARGQVEEKNVGRDGYIIKVPLPIVGNRDSEVAQQLRRLSEAAKGGNLQRPVVVLQFQSTSTAKGPEEQLGSRGSQFERCLSLARIISDREISNLRIVAYLPESVEGHAVLPILACQEIYAKFDVELGRAAIDSEADATVRAAYQDSLARGRTNIPLAAVIAMLVPNVELREVSTTNGNGSQIVTADEAKRLLEQGVLSDEKKFWNRPGLASFSALEMRRWLWISPTVESVQELSKSLGVEGELRSVQQLPREWKAVTIRISETLDRQQTNQLIRSINEAVDNQGINLLVFVIESTRCQFDDASRLASAIAELKERVYTTCFVESSLTGPVGLVATACGETVLIGQAKLGPDLDAPQLISEGVTEARVLNHLASATGRPLPLLAAIIDKDVQAMTYTHQVTGKRELFVPGQLAKMPDRDNWTVKEKVAGGSAISQEVALQYGLVNSVEESTQAGLRKLGLEQMPELLKEPWLDASIRNFISQPWVPRLLLTIGLMALMIELGNPGISIGGLVAALCFLGYFWIEGLNGNVEWLEILLFIGGLFALALEIFVLPGFGIFGITGLLMVFLSLVLAGQTFVWPGTSAEVTLLASNLFWVAFLGFAAMIGLLMMHKRLEKTPVFNWIALKPGGIEEIEELDEREAIVSYDYLLGQVGTTKTRLNPSGKAQFGGDIVSVVGSGGLIGDGTPVQVVEVRGNLVIVEELT
ncbi:MAG: NfeD family protein [Pirellulales bacterium]